MLKTLARNFYAMALLALGVQQLMHGKLIAGRPLTWPAQLSGQAIVAYLTGLLLIVVGVSTLLNKKFQGGLVAVGTFILGWAALRNVYGAISQADVGFLLTCAGKALSLGSGAFLVLRTFQDERMVDSNSLLNRISNTCRYCIGLFLLSSGVQHFLFADFVKMLVPTWIPVSMFWVYASAVALGLAGIALLIGFRVWNVAMAAGSMILSWVFILHLPRAFADLTDQNEMTAVFEALAFSGLLFLVAWDAREKQLA
jgi:uncharacterized membrane protein